MRVTLRLDDKYRKAVEQRISQLQDESARELERAGKSELAHNVAEADPDPGTYIKRLVHQDLADGDLLPGGESR